MESGQLRQDRPAAEAGVVRLPLASALVALAGLAAGTPLAAQARDVKKAAASITAKDVSRSIHLIADD